MNTRADRLLQELHETREEIRRVGEERADAAEQAGKAMEAGQFEEGAIEWDNLYMVVEAVIRYLRGEDLALPVPRFVRDASDTQGQ